MKIHTSLIAVTLATLFAGNAFANTHGEDAVTSMTVDTAAPIRATLLPTVSVDADRPDRLRIADTAPVEVTLLPTVHVTARETRDVATLLPTIRVTPQSSSVLDESIADADDFASSVPAIEDASPAANPRPLGLRARAMPR
jgi:hypothetical protein